MKAIICTKYGPPEVLQLRDVEKPIPRNNEVLIKIVATSVTASDCIIRGFTLPFKMWIPARLALGLTKPRKAILGLVLSGEVEKTGENVTQFKKGDKVFAHTLFQFGAEVTGVCSTANLDLVRSLGADLIIDYTKEDFTDSGKQYDLIFDAVGKKKSSHLPYKKALNPNGKFISVDDDSPGKRAICKTNLIILKDLTEKGIVKPVIDRIYPLTQIVDAHRYVDKGHKKGNVVITLK